MDAGDILGVKEVKIEEEDNCGTMFEKLSYAGRDLLMETIPALIEGKIDPIKQNEEDATFAYNVTKEEERLDFTKPARDVFNHIRAYNPYPVAYMMLGNDVIKVYNSRVSSETHNVEVGTVIKATKQGFLMACGNHTTLEVLEVQPSGKKVMKASDFANGALRKYL